MKIEVQEHSDLTQTEIIIRCPQVDEEVLRVLALLRTCEHGLTGTKDGETFLLEAGEVLYIDTVDARTFLYTAKEVYETPLRLYELEEKLEALDFFRASKSSIINFKKIQSLRPEFGGRMRCTMGNGEILYVSRQYVPTIKKKLGII